MLPPEILAVAAANPYGLISNRVAARAGATSWDLTRWVRDGLLERLAPGWYRVAGAPVPRHQELYLAQAYLRRRQRNRCRPEEPIPDALQTGGGALDLYGVEGIEARRPHALIDHDRRVRLAGAPFDVTRVDLRAEVWVERRLIALVEGARAVGDWADRDVPDREVRRVFDRLRHLEGVDLLDAMHTWAASRGAGFRRLLAMAHRGQFDQESEPERALYAQFLAAPPAPDCQVWITPRARVDFAWVSAGLILEYHGIEAHRDRVDEDAVRILDLRRHDAEVIVATKGVVRDPGFVAHVHDVRRRREHDIRSGRLPPPPRPLDRPRRVPLRTLGI